MQFCVGDMAQLPFSDGRFDVVLSTYSLCPLHDPRLAARELYRVTRPGGLIGIAHSTEPQRRWVRWLADRAENLIWRFPGLSMGCRAVEVLPALQEAGGELIFQRYYGVPLWPFLASVLRKPGQTVPA